jgi:hypothetical protein
MQSVKICLRSSRRVGQIMTAPPWSPYVSVHVPMLTFGWLFRILVHLRPRNGHCCAVQMLGQLAFRLVDTL